MAILAPVVAAAQDRARLPRIVVLSWSPTYEHSRAVEAGLRVRGHTNGTTLAIEYLSAEGRGDRLPALAKQAVAANPRVIVAIGTLAAIAAQQATRSVPIVTVSGDIVAGGLVKNLGRPEGNVTGLSYFYSDLMLKRLELLTELVPKLRRIGILRMARMSPAGEAGLSAVRAHAERSGIDLLVVTVERMEELNSAFATLRDAVVEGLLVMPTPNFDSQAAEIGRLASAHQLIAIFPFKEYVLGGGLVAYGPDLAALLHRAGTYVDRILRGAKPSDLPIEQPPKFELVINMKAAKALGLTVPRTVLLRADQVLE